MRTEEGTRGGCREELCNGINPAEGGAELSKEAGKGRVPLSSREESRIRHAHQGRPQHKICRAGLGLEV